MLSIIFLLDPYSLKCHGIPITPTLRETLEAFVHRFVTNSLNYCSNILKIDESLTEEHSIEIMERSIRKLFEQPNLDIISIEERATHQLRMEITASVRAFLLDTFNRMSDQERKEFLNKSSDEIFIVYYNPYEERFHFVSSDQAHRDDEEDEDHFSCGVVVLTSEDIEDIFD